jgi:hypothetical protein
MRKVLISLAAAATALAVAAPASAQWAPRPGYGYNNFGHVRGLQVRVDRIQREIQRLAQSRMISRNEYRNLNSSARDIERRLRHNARDGRGLDRREAYNIERRIVHLEQKIARDVRDGRRWGHRW